MADTKLPATFTSAEAEGHGVSRRALQHLQDTGAVERIGRGLYRRTDEEPVDHDLIEIAAKAHRPTLFLLSALAHFLMSEIGASAGMQLAVNIVGIAAMCLTAALLDWYRAMQRVPPTRAVPAGERIAGED